MSSFKRLLATAAWCAALGTDLAHATEPTDWCAVASQYAQPTLQAAKSLMRRSQRWGDADGE